MAAGANRLLQTEAAPSPRFWLWIDGVGGYLVCEGQEIVLGQPTPESPADVPLLGDLSRRHARLRRDGEYYVVEPWRGAVRVDGRTIEGPAALSSDNRLELGANIQLRFRRPHPHSATARLDFESRHTTQPAADAVLLLADSCVLGPGREAHVSCPGWRESVMLYRQRGLLMCRTAGVVEIDGRRREGGGELSRRSRVIGSDFSFALEPVQT